MFSVHLQSVSMYIVSPKRYNPYIIALSEERHQIHKQFVLTFILK